MKKKKRSFPVKPVLLLGAAAILLIGSTVGSTRAALTYYSENYSAQIQMARIGVSLLENDKVVSQKDYTDAGEWTESGSGELLTGMLGEGEKVALGKAYKEELTVQNTGSIDTFVRVILTKSWQGKNEETDKDGKNVGLSPELINLNIDESSGWVKSSAESSPERIVLYYTGALAPDGVTLALSNKISISREIAKKVTKTENKTEAGTIIEYKYDYDGYTFNIEAEVDAVQARNAQAAIKSAWGVDVNVSADEKSLSLL